MPSAIGTGAVGTSELWVVNLGSMSYGDATHLQHTLCRARQRELIPDTLLLLEHPPVYTLGRRAELSDLPMTHRWYRDRGIEIERTDRGGRVTYHGPGQLVGYPIMRISRVADYIHTMERALIAALADEGLAATVYQGLTGVWVKDKKIASIGVRVFRSVTTHGFAVNVENDLQPFEWIVPCGIGGVQMTSVAAETGQARPLRCFRKRIAWRFCESYGLRQRLMSKPRLLAAVETPAPTRQMEAVDDGIWALESVRT